VPAVAPTNPTVLWAVQSSHEDHHPRAVMGDPLSQCRGGREHADLDTPVKDKQERWKEERRKGKGEGGRGKGEGGRGKGDGRLRAKVSKVLPILCEEDQPHLTNIAAWPTSLDSHVKCPSLIYHLPQSTDVCT